MAFSLPEKVCWLMQTGKEAPGISHTQVEMGIPTTCSRKNFLLSIRRRTLPYTAALHREPGSSWKAAASGGGDGYGKIVFSVRDIAGVVLGPGNGCNVLYGKDYQVLAKFASSMEHADLMFLWLLQKKVSIVNAPAGWRSPAEDSPEPKPVKSSIPQQQFTLRLKRSARIGFAGMGWFVLLIGLALFLSINFFTGTIVERRALIVVALATMGGGVVGVRIGTVCQVEIDGEQVRVVSRFGRTKEFSVKEVSSVSKSLGWIVLYDREFNTLAKIDSYLENLDKLKEYFTFYGIKM